MTRRRLPRLRIPLLGAAALVASMALTGVVVERVQAEEAQAPLQRIDQLALPGGGRYVAIDASVRRAVVLCGISINGGVNHCGSPAAPAAVAYDLDTHAVVATIPGNATFPCAASPATSFTVDTSRHRLFCVGFSSNFTTFGQTPIVEVDMRTLKILGTVFVPNVMAGEAMAYAPQDHLLYLLAPNNGMPFMAVDPDSSTPAATVWEQSLSSSGCLLTSAAPTGVLPLSLGIAHDNSALYTLCFTGNQVSPSPVVAKIELAKDHRQPPARVQLYPGVISATFAVDSLFVPGFDRVAVLVATNSGYGLMVFDGQSGTFVASPALFETGDNTNVSFSTPTLGLDPSTGRVYAQTRAWATRSDNCQVPLPAEDQFATAEGSLIQNASAVFGTGDPTMDAGAHLMGFDPVTRSLWMIDDPYYAHGCTAATGTGAAGHQPALFIFHDTMPPAQPGSLGNLDAATQDIAEQAGSTGRNAGVQASAYGARYEMAPSGTNGPLSYVQYDPGKYLTCNYQSFYSGFSSALGGSLADLGLGGAGVGSSVPPVPAQYAAFCNGHNRTATLAHVDHVTVDSGEARAGAVAGDADSASADDLTRGSDLSQPGPYVDSVAGYVNPKAQPCPTNNATPPPSAPPQPTTCEHDIASLQPYLTGAAMPYTPAACGDFGGQAQPATPHSDQISYHSLQPNVPKQLSPSGSLPYPGYAAAGCDLKDGVASGHAETSGASLGIPVYAGDAITDVTGSIMPSDGSVGQVSVVVHDIVVSTILSIDRLTVTASTFAHGRPGTNGTRYACNVSGLNLEVPGERLEHFASLSCQDAMNVIQPLNDALSGKLQIDFPVAYDDPATAPAREEGLVRLSSPRGYMAQVGASLLERNSRVILLNDRSLEQPALTVTYYGDSSNARSRLLAMFGGLALSSQYGIYALDSGGGDVGSAPPPLGTVPPLPDVNGGATQNNPVVTTVQHTASSPLGGLALIYAAVVDGVRFFMQNPRYIPALLAVWLLFAAPPYMLSRRRELLRATEGTP